MLRGAEKVNNALLQISAVAYGGEAVGKLPSGKVCFVPGGLPGEELEVEIVQEKSSFARARLLKVVKSSPERIEAACRFFRDADCPGCAYLHCPYPLELGFKQAQLADFLIRSNLLGDGELLEPFASPQREFYRNKLKLRSDGSTFAMVARDNESLIRIDRCILADHPINDAIRNTPVPPAGTNICWRSTRHDGVRSYSGKNCPRNTEWLSEFLGEAGIFKVPQDGFFQTNPQVAAELVRRVTALISGTKLPRLVELYCGVGVFSIAAAGAVPELTSVGIELNPAAIRAARWNAHRHGVDKRCRFVAGDAGKELKKLGDISGCCLLVDPPRSGITASTLNDIIAADPEKIIYISCAADTLRRDLELFRRAGWLIESAGLLDMFPGTAHFETLVSLVR